jgi:S-phase kinase-associated protein 1
MSLTIKTNDDQSFELSVSVISKSETLKNFYDDIILKATGDDPMHYPLESVTGPIFQLAIDFLTHYEHDDVADIEKTNSTEMSEVVPEWDATFIDALDIPTLMELVKASDYLHINGLTQLTACKIAHLIKSRTVEEIRADFGIVNDFTEEEEAAVREETAFANTN